MKVIMMELIKRINLKQIKEKNTILYKTDENIDIQL